jgi:hypothetical protein
MLRIGVQWSVHPDAKVRAVLVQKPTQHAALVS